jgi:membrane-bound lytic murein transglycosylase D
VTAKPVRGLLPALSLLLTACVGTTLPVRHSPPIQEPALTVDTGVPQPISPPALAAPQVVDFWQEMRNSFAMSDCDADPSVLAWARRYTKNPDRFEDQLREAMPQLTYVRGVASHYDVAGEFVLLPWIESGFQSLPGRRNRPAGMWQIMPLTASKMGLRVDGRFDARLDVDASANAVMKMLKQYHDKFDDWRMVDYAFNTGEFKIAKLEQRLGTPPAEPVIPQWPVKAGTKEHLTRLLGMACVVRDPARFHVILPTISDDQQLVKVPISQSMPMAQVANQAGISIGTLKGLNTAFRSNTVEATAASHVMLPANNAEQFRDSLAQSSSAAQLLTASAPDDPLPPSDKGSRKSSAKQQASASLATDAKTHTVKSGESLWQIAKHYSVSTKNLLQWNHLHSSALKPGQRLKVSDTD